MNASDHQEQSSDHDASGPNRLRLRDSHLRSVLKAVSWRMVGTMDTFIVSFLVMHVLGGQKTNLVQTAKISGGIAGTEVITKVLLYYLHERTWARIPLGTIRKVFGRRPS